MTTTVQPILRIPDSVREDVLAYRERVDQFLRGETAAAAFRGYRVPMGIYEQRTDGRFMVRVRLGAGIALTHQLERIAELSKAYGNGILHVTTRQDIQIHEAALEDTPTILEGLLEAGLSSRGGGGNTVRNVSACPRAGLCGDEVFDVSPHAIAVAEYLLQHRSSFNLPRKYKIAFSGCGTDCAGASVADLGFFATIKGTKRGFRVYAGGGLGVSPRAGIRIEEFVTEEDVFEVAEAVRRLFDKHGDRANKHQARLRYVLNRLGDEAFIALYRAEREAVRAERLPGVVPTFRETTPSPAPVAAGASTAEMTALAPLNVLPESRPGRYTIRLNLSLGDITAEDLVEVGRIANQYGEGRVRATQDQDLLVTGIPEGNVRATIGSLDRLGSVHIGDGHKPVVCAGASTCRLGVCLSRNLASALEDAFDLNGIAPQSAPAIRISGCANSCGGQHIAEIGLEGTVQRHNDRLLPCYNVLAGARLSGEGAQLARRVGTVPAKLVPEFLSSAIRNGATSADALEALLEPYDELPDELPENYYFDFGATESFSLAGRGPGECGASVLDVVKDDIDEAKALLEPGARQSDDELYRALVAAARALLVIFGVDAKKDREIFTAFNQYLIDPGWVTPETRELLRAALDRRSENHQGLRAWTPALNELVARIEALFLSLDANLKFRIEPVSTN